MHVKTVIPRFRFPHYAYLSIIYEIKYIQGSMNHQTLENQIRDLLNYEDGEDYN